MPSNRTLLIFAGPILVISIWIAFYLRWKNTPSARDIKPLINLTRQWYIGRDPIADAKFDIAHRNIRLFGNSIVDESKSPFFGSSYHRILREDYSVRFISFNYGCMVPDSYVVPYTNSYNAIVSDYLKSIYGMNVFEKISAQAEIEAKLLDKEHTLQAEENIEHRDTSEDKYEFDPQKVRKELESWKSLLASADSVEFERWREPRDDQRWDPDRNEIVAVPTGVRLKWHRDKVTSDSAAIRRLVEAIQFQPPAFGIVEIFNGAPHVVFMKDGQSLGGFRFHHGFTLPRLTDESRRSLEIELVKLGVEARYLSTFESQGADYRNP